MIELGDRHKTVYRGYTPVDIIETLCHTELVLQSKSFWNRIGHLHEAVVSTAQHGLRLLDRINLARPRLTAHVEILQEEVARAVELRNVPTVQNVTTIRPNKYMQEAQEVQL